jgi:hypothetical protein
MIKGAMNALDMYYHILRHPELIPDRATETALIIAEVMPPTCIRLPRFSKWTEEIIGNVKALALKHPNKNYYAVTLLQFVQHVHEERVLPSGCHTVPLREIFINLIQE